MLKHVGNLGIHARLEAEVAPLAKSQEIPPFVESLVSVEMVDCEAIPNTGVVIGIAPDTLPVRFRFALIGDFFPILCVISREHHKFNSPWFSLLTISSHWLSLVSIPIAFLF